MLEVNGVPYHVAFNPLVVTPAQITFSFCSFHKESLKLVTDTDMEACEDALLPHVRAVVDDWYAKNAEALTAKPAAPMNEMEAAAQQHQLDSNEQQNVKVL